MPCVMTLPVVVVLPVHSRKQFHCNHSEDPLPPRERSWRTRCLGPSLPGSRQTAADRRAG